MDVEEIPEGEDPEGAQLRLLQGMKSTLDEILEVLQDLNQKG